MLFNSIGFAFFLPIVFTLYWLLSSKKLEYQNVLLLMASYFFYGCWDYRFLFLLIFSTGLDYYTGLKMYNAPNKKIKKAWFCTSVIVNLGFLAIFKYYNFFINSFESGLAGLGLKSHFWTLSVILPVGISFYTFHGLSYVIDIYNDKIKPERNFIIYSLFVSFFPLLVAGPIERATHLLPQLKEKRYFNYSQAVDGLKQILWGLFKKIVIADNLAEFVNQVFNNPHNFTGSTLLIAAICFAFQIYCDFSGYSDIALGTAKLFGIDLLRNFAFPYFSRDIAEFWRRWHISLSSWFRDYLYIPLGGSRVSVLKQIRNTFIIFVVSGFWHGANWTFIIWGFLNAVYIIPSILMKKNRNHLNIVAEDRIFPTSKEFFSMVLTFGLTVFAWIFFRSSSVGQAGSIISKIFSLSFFHMPYHPEMYLIVLLLIFLLIEWRGRRYQYAIADLGTRMPVLYRYAIYYSIIFSIFWFSGAEQKFIYFQF
ncbi:MAG: MBOAT family O-acyltransferase [Flavisolibacter sp.]